MSRSRWLPLMGGAAVSYVFLHLLPELTSHQRALADHPGVGPLADSAIYGVALAGLVAFYGLEHHARQSRPGKRPSGQGERDRPATEPAMKAFAFWVHALPFAAYNLLISFLLVHRKQPGGLELALYALAMSLHFVASDHGLRAHYQHRYDRIARWLFSAAVAAGWVLGLWLEPSTVAVGLLYAFLAGGVVLNVLKEELPFVAGAGGYALLLHWAR